MKFEDIKYSVQPTYVLLELSFMSNSEIEFELALLSTQKEKEKKLWDFCNNLFPTFVTIQGELEEFVKSWINEKLESLEEQQQVEEKVEV